MKRIASLFLVLTLALSLAVPVSAAETFSGTTLRLAELEGAVTVKDAAGKDKTARADMRLYNGYTIATGKGSSVFVKLDDTKAVKLGSNGKIEIKKNGKQLDIHLTSGELLANVTEKIKSDESVNVSTANFVTGIRGTVVGVSPKGVQEFDGSTSTTVFPRGDGAAPIDIPLQPGQKLDVEKILNAVQQAIDEYKSPEEVQQRLEEAAQPETLKQEDVSALVAEELANNPELADRVASALEEAGSDVSVDQAIEDLPALQAAEAAAEEAAEQQAEAALAQQSQEIAANDAADEAAGVSNDVSFTGGGDSSGGSSDSTSGSGSSSPQRREFDPNLTFEESGINPTPTPTPAAGSGTLAVANNLGVYNMWLTGAAGLPDYVGSASVSCSIHPDYSDGANGAELAELYVQFGFYQSFTVNGASVDASSYPTIRLAFTPAAATTAAPTIRGNNYSSASSGLTVSTPVLQSDGSWVVTCDNPLTPTSADTNAYLTFTVQTGTTTQQVSVSLSRPSNSGSGSQWTSCETWAELETLLSSAQYSDIDFRGTAPLDRNLTLPASPRVNFVSGLTIGSGKTLTLQGGTNESCYVNVSGDLMNNGTLVMGDNSQISMHGNYNTTAAPANVTLTNNGTIMFRAASDSGFARIGGSGVTLVNNGSIRGNVGTIDLDVRMVTGDYDDGVEKVEPASGANQTPDSYYHTEMKRLPASTVSYTKLASVVSGTGAVDEGISIIVNDKPYNQADPASEPETAYTATAPITDAAELTGLFETYDRVTVPGLGTAAAPIQNVTIPAGKTLALTGEAWVSGLTNNGTFQDKNGGVLYLYNGSDAAARSQNSGVFENDFTVYLEATLVNTGTITNSKQLFVGNQNGGSTAGNLANSGANSRIVNSAGATLHVYQTLSNAGTIENAGNFANYGGTSNDGTFNNKSGSTFYNASNFINNGTFNNAGTVAQDSLPLQNGSSGTVTGSTEGLVASSYTVKVPVQTSGYTLTATNVTEDQISSSDNNYINYAIPAGSDFTFTLAAAGGYVLGPELSVRLGTVALNAAESPATGVGYNVTLPASAATNGSVDLGDLVVDTVYEIVTVDADSLSGLLAGSVSRPVALSAIETFRIGDSGQTIPQNGKVMLYGGASAETTSNLQCEGSLVVGSGATLMIADGLTVLSGGSLVNYGTVNVNSDNTLTVNIGGTFTNNGTLTNYGDLVTDGTYVEKGTSNGDGSRYCTVTLNANGGTFGDFDTQTMLAEYGQTLNAEEGLSDYVPTSNDPGLTFKKWHTDAACTDTDIFTSQVITGPLTLYAEYGIPD